MKVSLIPISFLFILTLISGCTEKDEPEETIQLKGVWTNKDEYGIVREFKFDNDTFSYIVTGPPPFYSISTDLNGTYKIPTSGIALLTIERCISYDEIQPNLDGLTTGISFQLVNDSTISILDYLCYKRTSGNETELINSTFCLGMKQIDSTIYNYKLRFTEDSIYIYKDTTYSPEEQIVWKPYSKSKIFIADDYYQMTSISQGSKSHYFIHEGNLYDEHYFRYKGQFTKR